MPIDTTVEGDPNSIHAVATWLRTHFQPALHYCGSQVFRARANAEGGWQGAASSGFQAAMARGGRAIDRLHADAGALGAALDAYADGVHTAQTGMTRARQIARQGGLTVTGGVIADPGPPPAAPPLLPPPLAGRHADAVADHLRQVRAFDDAQGEADHASRIHAQARSALESILRELAGHRYEHATDFTNGVAGHLIEVRRGALRQQAAHLREEAARFEDHYLHSPGGSDGARLNEQLRNDAIMAAEAAESADGGLLARVASRIPGIGAVVVAGGVGWDVYHGTSPVKAIATNGVSVAAAAGGEAATTAILGTVGAAAPLVAVLAPLAAVGAGIAVAGLADYAWDRWVPPGTDQAIQEGLKLSGPDFIGGAETAWHALASVF